MLLMQLPDGTTCECQLRSTKWGLRLVRRCASFDLLAMVRDGGWVIREVKTDAARRHLARAFGPKAKQPQTLPPHVRTARAATEPGGRAVIAAAKLASRRLPTRCEPRLSSR
jgi:hypothetical protein